MEKAVSRHGVSSGNGERFDAQAGKSLGQLTPTSSKSVTRLD